MRPIATISLHAALAAALAAFPVSGAVAASDYYLKLDGVKGETTKGGHSQQIEIQSYSWGSTRSAIGSATGGAGSGKVKFNELATTRPAAKGESTEKGGTEDINIGVGELQEARANDRLRTAGPKDGAKGGNVEFEWKVEEGESAPPAPGGGVSVASGDVTGDGRASPKKPITKPGLINPRPLPTGSMTALVPAGICRLGSRYPTAEFGTPRGTYRMTEVVVVACSPARSASGAPMESISLNYEKIVW